MTLLALMSSVPHAPDSLIKWLSIFWVPLTVFISGFVWNNTVSSSGKMGIRILSRRWLLPYVVLSVISWIIDLVQGNSAWWRPAIGLLYGVDGFGHWMGGNGALWLFPFLFSVHFLAQKLLSYHWIWGVIASSLGFTWLHFSPFPMPWGMDVALAIYPFFLLGLKMRSWNVWVKPRRWSPWIAFGLLIGLSMGALNGWIPLADWNAGRLRPEWVVMSLSLLGVISWLPIARLLNLAKMGRHSLWIYGLHIPLFQIFSWLIGLLVGRALHSPDFLYLVVLYPVLATLLVMRIRHWLWTRNELST